MNPSARPRQFLGWFGVVLAVAGGAGEAIVLQKLSEVTTEQAAIQTELDERSAYHRERMHDVQVEGTDVESLKKAAAAMNQYDSNFEMIKRDLDLGGGKLESKRLILAPLSWLLIAPALVGVVLAALSYRPLGHAPRTTPSRPRSDPA